MSDDFITAISEIEVKPRAEGHLRKVMGEGFGLVRNNSPGRANKMIPENKAFQAPHQRNRPQPGNLAADGLQLFAALLGLIRNNGAERS